LRLDTTNEKTTQINNDNRFSFIFGVYIYAYNSIY